MNTYFPKIYVDESGNTGSNICDKFQRYFVLSAISFLDEELEQIQADINYPKELHFLNMKESIAGRKAIKKLLSHNLINSEHISYQLWDKTFCIYAQITDMTIEPVFHYIFHEDLYKRRKNILAANCLYFFGENHIDKNAINEFKISFMTMMREQSKRSIIAFYDNVRKLKAKSIDELNEFLFLIELSESILEYVLVEDNKYCLDTTFTSLISLTNHWYNKFQTKLEIIADNSKSLTAQELLINKFSNIKEECFVGYDTRKHTYPLPIHRFKMVDSKDSFGVQVADMIASAVTFRWNEPTKKYQKFHDEIAELDFFNLPCYPICPTSYEELSQPIDDSDDIDPLDFLVKNLEKE